LKKVVKVKTWWKKVTEQLWYRKSYCMLI